MENSTLTDSVEDSESLTGDENKNSDSETVDTAKILVDKKFQAMRISRINAEWLLQKYACPVKSETDLKLAEKIIKDIIGRKRKRNGGDSEFHRKKQRTEGDRSETDKELQHDDTSEEFKQDFQELELNPDIQEFLQDSGVTFKVKLFVAISKEDSKLTKTLSELLTENSKRSLLDHAEVKKSYVLFFYRNNIEKVDQNSSSKIIPEIFVLMSGSAWNLLEGSSKMADKAFPKRIEKRTLQFPFDHVEFEKECGVVYKGSKSARSGHKIKFSVWDFIDKLVRNRRRELRKNSSLYNSSLNGAFLNKTGNRAPTKIDVSNTALKINRELNLLQLGLILQYFSDIYFGKPTYLVTKQERMIGPEKQTDELIGEEEDEEMFEMQEFLEEVTDKHTKAKLNKYLHNVLRKSMEGCKSHICLTHKLLHEWQTASCITLLAKKSSDPGETKKRNRRCLNAGNPWMEPPSLEDVMELLRKECDSEYQRGWLDNDDVLIRFKAKGQGEPLKNFLFSSISAGSFGTHVYYYGTWLKMTVQYLYSIEKDFVEMLRSKIVDRSKLCWLLPWKKPQENNDDKKEEKKKNPKKKIPPNNQENASSRKTEKHSSILDYDIEKCKPLWQEHFTTICRRKEPFDGVYKEAVKQKEKKCQKEIIDVADKSFNEVAGNLYHRLECRLTEGQYNRMHILLNKICKDSCEMKIIVGDEKCPHYIELCDILMYNTKTTYLVHVKEGFDLGPIRAVCSQIRNAAVLVYRNQSCGTGLIQQYWRLLKESKRINSDAQLTEEKFLHLFSTERKIVFVLACRDTRKTCDFINDSSAPCNLKVNITERIREVFKGKYGDMTEKLIDELKAGRYLTEKGNLTDKFILDGKSTRGNKPFLQKVLSWKILKDDCDVKDREIYNDSRKSKGGGKVKKHKVGSDAAQDAVDVDDENSTSDTDNENRTVHTDDENRTVDTDDENRTVDTDDKNRTVDTNDENRTVHTDNENGAVYTNDENRTFDSHDENSAVDSDDENTAVDTFARQDAEYDNKTKKRRKGKENVKKDKVDTGAKQGAKNKEKVQGKKDAKKLHDLFVSGLSTSKSTGAKMEIIRLAQFFEKIGKKNLKFKIYSICHDFEPYTEVSTDQDLWDVDDSSDDEEDSIEIVQSSPTPSTSKGQGI